MRLLSSFRSLIARSLVTSMSKKPGIVFVLGAPGSGKGTQCDRIVSNYGFVHLSAGDLLREEQNTPGSQFGDIINGHIVNGTIVPVEITCSLIEKAMNKSGADKFLIDGFPRNQNNLDGWNTAMAEKVKLLFVLFFDCAQDVCIERCLKRGAAGSGRADDNMDSLRKRFDTYMNATMPIIKHYEAQGLVHTVQANSSADQVFEVVKGHFDELNNKKQD